MRFGCAALPLFRLFLLLFLQFPCAALVFPLTFSTAPLLVRLKGVGVSSSCRAPLSLLSPASALLLFFLFPALSPSFSLCSLSVSLSLAPLARSPFPVCIFSNALVVRFLSFTRPHTTALYRAPPSLSLSLDVHRSLSQCTLFLSPLRSSSSPLCRPAVPPCLCALCSACSCLSLPLRSLVARPSCVDLLPLAPSPSSPPTPFPPVLLVVPPLSSLCLSRFLSLRSRPLPFSFF